MGILLMPVIKFVGYVFAAYYLRAYVYLESRANIFFVGLGRAVLGYVIGAPFVMGTAALLDKLGVGKSDAMVLLTLAMLIPARLVEWWLVLRVVYARRDYDRSKLRKWTLIGAGWSCVLDIPVALGFVALGGPSIC